jgi:hypothetical protein
MADLFSTTEERRRLAGIVRSFEATKFNPDILLSHPHLQTIIPALTPFPRTFQCKREKILTSDGDFFYVDFTISTENDADNTYNDAIVVLLHGLESNMESPLMTKITSAFLAKGFSNCCLVSFRGCTGEENITPGAYHLGFTKDVHHLIEILHSRYPDKKIYLAGFSLGGNVALKFLGELGSRAKDKNIFGGVVTCVPFDPIASQGKLDENMFNRMVYSNNFLKTLKVKAEKQIIKFPGSFDIEKIRQCNTIGEFDDAYIAKIYGFKDREDYYRQSGSKWWLPKISVPCIAINARDDPFIEESSLPSDEDLIDKDIYSNLRSIGISFSRSLSSQDISHSRDDRTLSIERSRPVAADSVEDVDMAIAMAPIRLIYTDNGGHCGFMSSLFENVPKHGWLAEELSRALEHIHKNSH